MHHKSKMLISLLLMLVLAISMITVLSQWPQGPEDTTSESPIPARITYAEHWEIFIDGNAGFLGPNASTGISRGSGTESDPYIIEGWIIEASIEYGIYIKDADVHFIVRNCYIYPWSGPGAEDWIWCGIYISGCSNGTLDSNICWSSESGGTIVPESILLGGGNNTLINNSCYPYSYYRAHIHIGSNSNTVSKNKCSFMGFYHSDNNIISNNGCQEIALSGSGNNTISENGCRDIKLYKSSNNIISNNTCHMGYYGYGISVDSSDNNTINDNTCSSNAYDGIYLNFSNNNTISNNNCSSNMINGLRLHESSDNTLIWNQFCDNDDYGVFIESGSDNIIWNNTLYHNNGAGDTYDPLHVQAYDAGTNNWWNCSDGYGNWWSDWTTPDVDPPDGIVDDPYNIAGTAGAKDYYPLTTTPTEPIPEFSLMPLAVTIMLAAIALAREGRRRKA